LVTLEERLVAPLGRERSIGADAVQALKNNPRSLGSVDGGLLNILHGFGHDFESPLMD
jgi:hypothetical protein